MNKHLFVIVTCGWAVACGGAQPRPQAPTTTSAQVEPKKAEPAPEPAPAVEEAKPEPAAEPAPAPEEPKPPRLESCDGNWVCVSVSPKNKIDKRLTQLIGDPQFDSTQSAMIDDARGPAKLELDGKTYEIALRRGAVSQIVLRGGAGEVVLDKHKANDFTYVGIIATKNKDGAVLVDIKYMK